MLIKSNCRGLAIPLTQEDVLGCCIDALIKFPKDPNVKKFINFLLKNISCPIDPQNIILLLDKKIILKNGEHWQSSDPNQLFTIFERISLLGASAFLNNEVVTKYLMTKYALPPLYLELPLAEYQIEPLPYRSALDTEITQKRERNLNYITPESFISHNGRTPAIKDLFTTATKKFKLEKTGKYATPEKAETLLRNIFAQFDSLDGDNAKEIQYKLRKIFEWKKPEHRVCLNQENILIICIEAVLKYGTNINLINIIIALLTGSTCKIAPRNITLLVDKPLLIECHDSRFASLSNLGYVKFSRISLLGIAALVGANTLVKELLVSLPLLECIVKTPTQPGQYILKTSYITASHFCTFLTPKVGNPEIQEYFIKAIFTKSLSYKYYTKKKKGISPPPRKKAKISQPNEKLATLSPPNETEISQAESLARFGILPAPETPAWEPLSEEQLENMNAFPQSVQVV
jgi:hypothetical protein